MATESVTNESVPTPFSGNDASVYVSQAMAVADLLAIGDHRQCARQTVNEASMLIFMLLDASRELAEAERAEFRAKLSKQESKA
ncbi:hypothetical protein ASD55_07830 [Rhodanobacter sp. Root561]|uniref:hypothetical protein n=1 Tax=Rhodanobacter sp. Root561 TaxID=1736560 RepID=UPI0006FB5A84|nr:hypothetical protein [Rhodanobacter sp. Root561]KQZ77758.1 hypothetical protein ASD55_07830 [Rhodanobacter sp. Root561]